MYPRRIARFILSNAVWMVLSSCIVLATVSPTVTSYHQWFSINPGAIATISFCTSGDDWNMTIQAYGYPGYSANTSSAPFIVTVDGFPTTSTSLTGLPLMVTFPVTNNHVHDVVISADNGTTGLFIRCATVWRFDAPVQDPTSDGTVVASPTTQLQDPLTTTTANTTTVAVVNSTVVPMTNSTTSQASVTTRLYGTLDGSLIHSPSANVSLTSSEPSFNSTNGTTTYSSKQTKSGTYVAAALGALAFVSICFFAGIMLYFRRRRKRIPPSMAYTKSRSTTFHTERTAFAPDLTNNRVGAGGGDGGGFLSSPRPLSPLDENSAEWSMNTPSPVALLRRSPSLDMAVTLSLPSSASPTAPGFPLAPSTTRSARTSRAYDGT
jgi:hypothetical protein